MVGHQEPSSPDSPSPSSVTPMLDHLAAQLDWLERRQRVSPGSNAGGDVDTKTAPVMPAVPTPMMPPVQEVFSDRVTGPSALDREQWLPTHEKSHSAERVEKLNAYMSTRSLPRRH